MNSLVVVLALAACASAAIIPAPIAFRTPSHDSAIIQSHRLGGNFAYSTHEAHAYGVQTPIIGTRTVPVGVSYVPGTPIVKTSTHLVTHKIPQVVSYGAPFHYPYALGPVVAAAPAADAAVDTTAAEKPAVVSA
ncbi:uncharacterized protein LOC135100869 [Scylla paramamosain]